MSSEFGSCNNSKHDSWEDSPVGKLAQLKVPSDTLDMQKRDRFELLSAYLDGEVSAAERQQVQEWLATDSQVQCLYNRLLKLRQGLRTLPVPSSEQTAAQTAAKVFASLDHRRHQQMASWGGAAIAALFVAVLTGILPGNRSFSPQFVQSPQPEAETSEPLMIALNKPLVNIPKAAVATPEKSLRLLNYKK